MMGPSHALSGAAAWLAGSVALDHFGALHQTPLQLAVGTAMCAGGALLPDLDLSGKVTANRGGATVAHTFGVVSLFVAECVEKLSLGVYKLTRGSKDPDRENGHRTLTHTILFNVLLGLATTALCWRFGKWAVIGVLFVTFAMTLRGLFVKWAKQAGWLIVTLASAAAAFGVYQRLPSDRGYPILGLAIGVGGIVHLLGDLLTDRGCPLFWPMPLGKGRMWRAVGVPDAMVVKVGGSVEVMVLRTAFTIVALATGAWLLAKPVMTHFDLDI
jgi:membrane-bound metal-dependent hydrolase YbcI (DUF457 family)